MTTMTGSDALTYNIAFASYRNITVGTARRFHDLGISPRDFFENDARKLSAITGLREIFFDDARRQKTLESARRACNFVTANNVKAIFAGDDHYPTRLAQCDDAPAVLFTLGNACHDAAHVVSIVGTRHCTNYGAEFAERLVCDLAEMLDKVVIVSGLAYGIDICAHRAAIKAGIPTGAVLAHGLSTIYPAEHRNDARRIIAEGGFLMTEYASDAQIHRGNFLARNRIVAGLADVTVVVESDLRGGAMTTAHIAAAYDREVMAAPGRATDQYSRGCNALIARREASIIRDAADLVELMNWTVRPAEGTQQELPLLTPEQSSLLQLIIDKPMQTVNDLCAATGLPVQHLSTLLFDLEMGDMIVTLPGGRYAPVLSAR